MLVIHKSFFPRSLRSLPTIKLMLRPNMLPIAEDSGDLPVSPPITIIEFTRVGQDYYGYDGDMSTEAIANEMMRCGNQ